MKKGALLFSVFNFGGGESGLPDGGAGRPNGLTCAPAGAMQASNRRQAALSESQRGCGLLNGSDSKLPATPPLPLRGTSPSGGSEDTAASNIHPPKSPQQLVASHKKSKTRNGWLRGGRGEGCVWSCLSLRRNCPLPAVWTIQFVPNLGISCQTPCQKRK